MLLVMKRVEMTAVMQEINRDPRCFFHTHPPRPCHRHWSALVSSKTPAPQGDPSRLSLSSVLCRLSFVTPSLSALSCVCLCFCAHTHPQFFFFFLYFRFSQIKADIESEQCCFIFPSTSVQVLNNVEAFIYIFFLRHIFYR